MFVRTERLFLRPGWPEDYDELVAEMSGDEVECDAGAAAMPRTAESLRAYLDRPRDPRLPHFFMYLRAPGGAQLVGSIGLGQQGQDVEVGYWIAARHRGKGFAREALRAVVNQARTLGHARITASPFPECHDRHEALESAGFQDTGQVRSRYSPVRAMEYAVRIYVAEPGRRTASRMNMAMPMGTA